MSPLYQMHNSCKISEEASEKGVGGLTDDFEALQTGVRNPDDTNT